MKFGNAEEIDNVKQQSLVNHLVRLKGSERGAGELRIEENHPRVPV
jgi:hypothetical protein